MSSFLPSIFTSVPEYFAIQHLIPNFYFHGNAFTIFIAVARSRRQDLAFLGFLFSGFGKDDTSSSHFFLLDRFHDHTSAKGFNFSLLAILASLIGYFG